MPTYFWLSQSANLLTSITAMAALLLVLWVGPRRWSNRSFALFLATIIIWMAASFMVRLVLYVPGLNSDPLAFLEWATVGFSSKGLPLFWFIHTFYPIRRRAFWTLSILGGLELIAIQVLLFSGQIVSDPRPILDGTYGYTISPVGYWLSLGMFVFEFIALGILLRYAAWRTSRALFIGTLLIVVCSVATVLQLTPFPFQTYGMAIGTLFLAYEVLQQQLFNPMLIHNQRLELEVAQRTAELRSTLAERERVQSELRVARMIQMSLLPQAMPEHAAFEIFAQSLPAEEVGGDFFSFHQPSVGRLSLAVGDVSGKGVPAAILMALTINSFETLASSTADPGQLLGDLNTLLSPRMQSNRMNAAVLCVMLDSAQRQIKVANAGLIAPLLWRAGDVSYIDSQGLPLGARAAEVYQSIGVSLQPGDRLLLISDGAVEAMNERREMFGFDRLEQVFAVLGAQPASTIVAALLVELTLFTGAAPRHDDITVMLIAAC
ncbi:MAG: SpoIIE family protein phosphatase [Herpetosiphonaceae bacterium]|nr:SpoIIE family protein phosphatase [Herpetosiphonaceae bacterium]